MVLTLVSHKYGSSSDFSKGGRGINKNVLVFFLFSRFIRLPLVWCPPRLRHCKLWREERVWSCSRSALWLCSPQQQRHEDRCHLWVRMFTCCNKYGEALVLWPSFVSWSFVEPHALASCAPFEGWYQFVLMTVFLVSGWVLPMLAPTEKMSYLCYFLSWETPNPAWRYDCVFHPEACCLPLKAQFSIMCVCKTSRWLEWRHWRVVWLLWVRVTVMWHPPSSRPSWRRTNRSWRTHMLAGCLSV